MDNLKGTIPVTSRGIAIFILIVNIFFPGLGTIIMSCLTKEFTFINIILGIAQAVLSICIVGWIWSVIWGLLCYELASDDINERLPLNNDISTKNAYNEFYRVETDFKPNYKDTNRNF